MKSLIRCNVSMLLISLRKQCAGCTSHLIHLDLNQFALQDALRIPQSRMGLTKNNGNMDFTYDYNTYKKQRISSTYCIRLRLYIREANRPPQSFYGTCADTSSHASSRTLKRRECLYHCYRVLRLCYPTETIYFKPRSHVLLSFDHTIVL
jgi:hypothetical protein